MYLCTVSINIFDYVSTPVIFGILGMEIIYFDHYHSLTAAQLAAAISKVSKACNQNNFLKGLGQPLW